MLKLLTCNLLICIGNESVVVQLNIGIIVNIETLMERYK